jgi:ABC-type transport system involved in multi-copper enzyme maturation permease subunit
MPGALLTVVNKEIREKIVSLRFGVTWIVCLAVLLPAILISAKEYRKELSDYHNNVRLHEEEILTDDYAWNGLLWYKGAKVDKPPNIMSIFCKGTEKRGAETVLIDTYREPQFLGHYRDNPLFLKVDMVFFVSVVMSLLAVVYSYDSISGERENGTLRLLMSYSIPRDLVILGKWLGGYLSLILPFCAVYLLSLLIASLNASIDFTAQNWLMLILIFLSSLLYLLAVYSIGMLVSLRCQRSITSAITLLMIWSMMVLVIPGSSQLISQILRPVDSLQEVEMRKMLARTSIADRYHRAYDRWRRENPDRQWSVYRKTYALERMAAYGKINSNFAGELGGQTELAQFISRISPASSFVYLASGIAGTGVHESERFRKVVSEHAREFVSFAWDGWESCGIYWGVRENIYSRKGAKPGETEETVYVEDYPRFVYRESRLTDRMKGVMLDILALMLWAVLFFIAAYVFFMRADVR